MGAALNLISQSIKQKHGKGKLLFPFHRRLIIFSKVERSLSVK